MRFGSVCSGIEAASTAWEPVPVIQWLGKRIAMVDALLRARRAA